MGLSIVHQILLLHDAPHGVVSQVGEGTTIWLRLREAEHEAT